MKFSKGTVTVAGIEFEIFADFTKRSNTAINKATGEERVIRRSAYLHNELSIRKAVAVSFGLPTFRTK